MISKENLREFSLRAKEGTERKKLWQNVVVAEKSSLGRTFFVNGKDVINFGNLNSLGIGNHPLVIERDMENLRKYGTGAPSTRSLLEHEEFEKLSGKILEFENRPKEGLRK